MLKYIKSLLYKPKPKPQVAAEKCDQIIFTLSKDGLMDMEIIVHSNDYVSASNLGDMLYSLNNGAYADKMVTTVMSIGKNNTQYLEFSNRVILRWHAILNVAKGDKNKPIVPPSQFGSTK
jgi:hypothetical protein